MVLDLHIHDLDFLRYALGEPDREIFQRYYFFYQKTEEIAKSLGLKDTTVRTKLARGRKRLKEYLTEVLEKRHR